MVSDNFSASAPKGPMTGSITPIMGEVNATGYVPPQARRRLENKLVLVLPYPMFRTILERMEMRKCSGPHKRNDASRELRKNVEKMYRIQRIEEILLKPQDETLELASIMHSMHF